MKGYPGLTEHSKICPECKGEFVVTCLNAKKKFCSHSCSAKANNRGRVRSGAKYCSDCGKYLRKASGKCKDCVDANNLRLWLAGDISGNGAYTIRAFVRRFIHERDGGRCVECGFCKNNPYSNKSILHVDHKDGNWQNSTPENLRLLCPNCHGLTENYGALNMGNGRKWKAKYKQF